MPKYEILIGPRFLTLAGSVEANHAEDAATLGAYRFLSCDGVARVAGAPSEEGIFRTTHGIEGGSLQPGEWFLVRGVG